MIYYSYELRWKNFDPEKASKMYRTRSAFEMNYSSGTLESLNDKFFNDYAEKEDILYYITARDEGTVMVYVAAKVNSCDESIISQTLLKTFPDCTVHRSHEVTVDEFKRNVENTDYGSGRRVLTKLKIDYRSAGIFDPLPYKWSEQVIDMPKLNEHECKKQAERILASKSFKDELKHTITSARATGAAQEICTSCSSGRFTATADCAQTDCQYSEISERVHTVMKDTASTSRLPRAAS